ncbi:hypothetical protein IFM89_028159 [Coptis chinensis]|uniref:Uncharacterized protein n=1 Tax=Coptis chinensis TaxID=261450 RepID=A0A835HYM6_9MAGN|nr:hypothetical protein IFM89_028159 [Coptis chinensis]
MSITRVLSLHYPPPFSKQRSNNNLSISTLLTLHSLTKEKKHGGSLLGIFSCRNRALRVRALEPREEGNSETSTSSDIQNGREKRADEVLGDLMIETSDSESSFLAKMAIALGIAATLTIICVGLKWPSQGSNVMLPVLTHGSSTSASAVNSTGFTVKAFGYQFILPAYAPGWIYFWLLMAAGCGLFVSEEALNIWVGISLARLLTLDGTWASFAESFSRNASYIISTVLWVYWGVCISDMVPFYFGKLFRRTGASNDVCSKLGIDKEKAVYITRAVQKYGNLIGFVERFSIGVRNPTAFLAGALGISADCFFAGVCLGGLITLPVQLAIGFFLRERPVVALASVATIVHYSFSCADVTPVSCDLKYLLSLNSVCKGPAFREAGRPVGLA